MVKTYGQLYLEARRAMKAAGSPDPAPEARRLLAFAAGKTEAALLRDLQLYPGDGLEKQLQALLARYAAGEPLAYLLGTWEFRGLELEVNPHVLIPRSDTETVTEAALALLQEREQPRVLDLCTGSGCIGLSLASALPTARVFLADVDRNALAVARLNCRRLGLSRRVLALEADALAPPPPQLRELDLLISNPPYIPTGELETLEPSVRDFEPHLALDGGADGLDFYRAIFARWLPCLKQGGVLALECGETQSTALLALGREAGLSQAQVYLDCAGLRRALTFIRN